MVVQKLSDMKEFGAAGLYEEPSRSLFYRKGLGLRRFYESCALPIYHGEALYPSGRVAAPHYMDDMAVDMAHIGAEDREAAEEIAREFYRYHSSVPAEHTVAGNMWTHSIPNYERFLREGLLSYIPRIERIADTELKEGLLHLVEGICCYHRRCVRYLEEVGAEERLIAALKRVPLYPAENIYEAVVAWNFIMYLDSCDNLGCVASGLLPYYNGEDITELLKNLFDNLDANEGYSMALGADYNPLTLQCLEASKGKRRPMIELFVDEKTPKEVWDKAFEVTRTANGQPAFYNPQLLLGGLQKRFPNITDADVKKFCGGGCTEAMIAGFSNVGSLDAGINLPLILERCMKAETEQPENFEDFYNRFIAAVREVMTEVTREIGNSQRERAEYCPLPRRTLLIDDCIDVGLEYNNGGARYKWSIINFAGMINVIDSLLVLKDLVFENAVYSLHELMEHLEENDADFIATLRNHSVCFGIDHEMANLLSNRLSTDIFTMTEGKKPYFGEGFLAASIQFMSQIEAGRGVGATPDGR